MSNMLKLGLFLCSSLGYVLIQSDTLTTVKLHKCSRIKKVRECVYMCALCAQMATECYTDLASEQTQAASVTHPVCK